METMLLGLINDIHRKSINIVTDAVIQENRNRFRALTYWYYGKTNDISNDQIRKALSFLTWAYCEAEAFSFWPQEYRDKIVNDLTKEFQLTKDKVFDLYETKDNAFREKKTQFIAFEGIDGSGKTSYIDFVEKNLKAAGKKVLALSYPEYSSFIGKVIGELLSGKESLDATSVDPKSMCLWYATDRWYSLKNINVQDYDYILFNRYTLSNAVYQGIRNGNELPAFSEWVFHLEHKVFSIPIPDIYFIFDIDPTLAQQNIEKKGHRDYIGTDSDVYERSKDYLSQARELYLKINCPGSRVEVINVTREGELNSISVVGNNVLKVLYE